MTHIEAMQGGVHSAVRLRYTRNSRCILCTLKQYHLFHAHALQQHFKYGFWTFMLVCFYSFFAKHNYTTLDCLLPESSNKERLNCKGKGKGYTAVSASEGS